MAEMGMDEAARHDEAKRLALEIARILDECRLSQAVHRRKLKDLKALRCSSHIGLFLNSFTRALNPLFGFAKRTVSTERTVRFVSAFAALQVEKSGDAAVCNAFLEGFLKFLLVAARAANKTARLRGCQIISEIIMLLPDDVDVSDGVWDEAIDCMKERMQDKVPTVRVFAVRALSHFASDAENSDISDMFLETLHQEQNADVRKTIVLSMPATSATSVSIIERTLDVHESVRKAAYSALSSKFPLQSLSIKIRTTLLQRGLADRSSSVTNECLKMLKDEWLTKCCNSDPVTLLRYLDVETYESVGEAVMEALLKEGTVQVQEGQSIRNFLASASEKMEGENNHGILLMDAEVALYWRTVCRHLQVQAQAKGSDAAATMGAEAAVYASEASDSNDLLENVLPVTISDYVELVKAHLSAGPNFRFSSRQLLLLGAILDFSDTTNRKAASGFVHELLCRPIEHEVDDDGNEIIVGDGINLGGEREWSRAVSELAKKVHASLGEFEEVIAAVIEELARPCRERSAAMMDWMHCLAVTGLLLENVDSYRFLQGKSIEPTELLHSLLLPAARQVHVDVQRVAIRCLGLFGLVERRPSEELVKQLRLSFINGQPPVRIMAGRALIDLATWHRPQELDRAIGLDTSASNDKCGFTSVDLSNGNDDLSIGLLDLLFSALESDGGCESSEVDDLETVHGIVGEGFAKILILSQNYPSVSTCLHPLILGKLVLLYFCSEAKELERLKQCLSVFFDHYAALSGNHKKFVSTAFVPVMRSAWPGVYGNTGGSSVTVSKLRKRATNISRFMLQMMQTPLYSKEVEDAELSETTPGSLSTSGQSTLDIESGEEGLAIRIGAEVAGFPAKKTAAGKSYMSALCKIATALKFRPSQQDAIKCMRGLLNHMMEAVPGDREVVKELVQMAAQLRTLDEHPDGELSPEDSGAIFATLELDVNLKMDISAVPAATPAPRSTRGAAASRRRARREATFSSSSSDDDEGPSAAAVPVTPSITATRMQRTSKTMAMSRMSASVAAIVAASTDSEGEGNSEVTSEGVSDESTGEESFE